MAESLLRVPLTVVLVVGIGLGLLALFQDRLVYFPRAYPFAPESLPAPLVLLRFQTADGAQHAVWRPPTQGPAARVWMMFGGNAMTALDWLPWIEGHPDTAAGFLLIDYPGYGWSEGAPSPDGIHAVAQAALASLHAHLGTRSPATCLFGHSLGAAAALRFATEAAPACVILSAPFVRLQDVAAHHYGGWVRPLVRGGLDNDARLTELGALRPAVLLVHGDANEIIPVAQSRELARRHPWVRYLEVAGARHNDLLGLRRAELHREMRVVAGVPL